MLAYVVTFLARIVASGGVTFGDPYSNAYAYVTWDVPTWVYRYVPRPAVTVTDPDDWFPVSTVPSPPVPTEPVFYRRESTAVPGAPFRPVVHHAELSSGSDMPVWRH